MASSKAATPQAYIDEQPEERRPLLEHLRALVNANLPDGYVERMNWGMISWELPLQLYPDTYNQQPLAYAGLAAQKHHTALYLTCVYASEARAEQLKQAFAAAGKTLDMGKSCIRFKRPGDVADAALAAAIAAAPPAQFIAEYEAARARR
jgi:hypothetical protein